MHVLLGSWNLAVTCQLSPDATVAMCQPGNERKPRHVAVPLGLRHTYQEGKQDSGARFTRARFTSCRSAQVVTGDQRVLLPVRRLLVRFSRPGRLSPSDWRLCRAGSASARGIWGLVPDVRSRARLTGGTRRAKMARAPRGPDDTTVGHQASPLPSAARCAPALKLSVRRVHAGYQPVSALLAGSAGRRAARERPNVAEVCTTAVGLHL